MRRLYWGLVASLLAGVVVVSGLAYALGFVPGDLGPSPSGSGAIPVVAAENFWGSLVAQLGGSRVSVTSIVSDPNADPHEYESNTSTAVAIANAQLVIENGAGYDSWCSQLVSADGSSGQIVLNVAGLLGKSPGDNPHFWYSPSYVNLTLAQMYSDLVALDPLHAGYFAQQYATLNASLATTGGKIAEIEHRFQGVHVASTESIFVYLANSTGLDLVSPPAFMNAVADGIDPPAASVAEFQSQLEGGNVSVLVYNQQTVTPLTESMKSLAVEHNVSLVGITETIQPPGLSYQAWLGAELLALNDALAAHAPPG